MPLGAWVLHAACKEARSWAASGLGPVPVTVNVSARQLLDPEFERVVTDALESTGLDSSLGHLRELPIDILKIARPFVRELTDDDHDPALVRGIIELARSLGLRLVAEGIEYAEQHAILRAFDCQLGQGFLFARPMPGADLRSLLGAAVRA